MKLVIWIVLLFTAAVVAAMSLGANDGLASFYWRGWRADVSLNLFIVSLVLLFVAMASSVGVLRWLIGLPQRAKAWRNSRKEQALHAALREAVIEFHAARYSRAVKAAERVQQLLLALPDYTAAAEVRAIAHLQAAMALHRLQNKAQRDQHMHSLQSLPGGAGPAGMPAPRVAALQEGATLLKAEWSLDDRDAAASLQWLKMLPPGAARRTQALRLRMQAQRLSGSPLEALRSARLLAKHQAFTPDAAASLMRTLARAALDAARDADELIKIWNEFDREDRRDAAVLARAVERAGALQAQAWGRRLLKSAWEGMSRSTPADEREMLVLALWPVLSGIEPEWLPLLEQQLAQHPREPVIAAVAGLVFAERQLFGKAQQLLEPSAAAAGLPQRLRSACLVRLAHLALDKGDEARAAECFRRAAESV